MLRFFLFDIVIILIVIISYYYLFPQEDLIDISKIPKSFFIESLNRICIQNNNECAAFSSAFVLRHFGIEADGNELYKNYPKKLLDGTISPKGIIKYFKRNNYNASFFKGNINTLKKQISNGTPIITLVKVFPDKRYLHYVPVVGYDEEYIYLADSLKFTTNCNKRNYNRKISINDFETIWRTWVPFYKNTYIVVCKCEKNK
ncbi:C39 family peptidase [Clostridium folliculivorans]|uniref:C39 family peptidase n=1 Tax=Clostridium folliculivorans TaxID=2886038 RepID=UPI0021C3CBA7|nr:C39 family peptidase [Clostridium folliculivorans]GKU30176.1 hypothetical protein CFB3_22830 [Clostridium folliculivorans]